jgi:3-dehydroquinate dehydratase type I
VNSKICVSLSGPARECAAQLRRCELAELRLDLIPDAAGHLPGLFGGPATTIATCRPGKLSPAARRDLLLAALEAGADLVDVEHDAPASLQRALLIAARRMGRRLIVSFHDFEGTPERAVLDRQVRRAFERGADLVKVACRVDSPQDAARLLGLLDGDVPLVVVGMGEQGRLVRLVAPLLGSAFTFAAPSKARRTAPGQLDLAATARALRLLEKLGGGR